MLSAYETGKQRPSFATIDKILFALRFDAGDLARALKIVNQPDSTALETPPNGEAPQIVDLQLGRILEDGLSTEDLEPLEQEIVYRLLPTVVLMLRYLRK